MCPLCKTTFRSADDLQCHTKSYCQGTPQISVQSSNHLNGSPHSAPISPVGSPSHKYHRSNSFNMYLPEKYSPNTLAKLACSTIRHHLTPLTIAKLTAYHAAGYHPKQLPTSLAPITVCTGVPAIGTFHIFPRILECQERIGNNFTFAFYLRQLPKH